MKIFLVIVLTTLTSLNTFALNFKVRAREHFTHHEVHSNNSLEVYKGLTNTINMWWEKPYEYSFGFSFMPVIAGLRADDKDSPFGEKITHQNIGVEFKYFPKIISDQFFIRPGLGYSRLETNRGDKKNYYGNFIYLGAGVEIPMDNFGLALEMAYRHSNYSHDIYIKSITPSIGFHFYEKF